MMVIIIKQQVNYSTMNYSLKKFQISMELQTPHPNLIHFITLATMPSYHGLNGFVIIILS